MKNLLIAFMSVLSLSSFAQEHRKMSNLSPEQSAELHSKKMTLNLDLNTAQQAEIYNIELARAKERKSHLETRKEAKELSDNERFELKSKMLDAKIAYQNKIKSVLTEAQYTKWQEERHSERKGRQAGKKERRKH
jgi:hypothetical protein